MLKRSSRRLAKRLGRGVGVLSVVLIGAAVGVLFAALILFVWHRLVA